MIVTALLVAAGVVLGTYGYQKLTQKGILK